MTEAPKVGLKLKNLGELDCKLILSKSLPPVVQEKRKKLGGRSAPPQVLKGPKCAGLNSVKQTLVRAPFSEW